MDIQNVNGQDLISQFAELIKGKGIYFSGEALPRELLLHEEDDFEVYYAPFEHINTDAKIVFCGITPGAQQAEIALNTVAREIQNGAKPKEALKTAKQSASFAGPMRSNLSKMLDHVGIPEVLGIDRSSDLFGTHSNLVHYTSAMKNPVFYRGKNYSGSPSMLKNDALSWQIEEFLIKEIEQLSPETLFIPLGPKVTDVFNWLVDNDILGEEQVLSGIPHPSGANAERIKYFCGEKPRELLSAKTNAEVIDDAKRTILEKLEQLRCVES